MKFSFFLGLLYIFHLFHCTLFHFKIPPPKKNLFISLDNMNCEKCLIALTSTCHGVEALSDQAQAQNKY